VQAYIANAGVSSLQLGSGCACTVEPQQFLKAIVQPALCCTSSCLDSPSAACTALSIVSKCRSLDVKSSHMPSAIPVKAKLSCAECVATLYTHAFNAATITSNHQGYLIQDTVSKCATLQVFCHYVCRQCWLCCDLTICTVRFVMAVANIVHYKPANTQQ